jgi:hypothetical protein
LAVKKALIFSERLTTLYIAAGGLPQTDLLRRLEETAAAFITNALEDPDVLVLMHRPMRAWGCGYTPAPAHCRAPRPHLLTSD